MILCNACELIWQINQNIRQAVISEYYTVYEGVSLYTPLFYMLILINY